MIYGNHHASAPGHPPAPDTGFLRSSVSTELRPAENKALIGPAAEYAEVLETVKDRPFMLPVSVRIAPIWEQVMAQVLSNWSNQE